MLPTISILSGITGLILVSLSFILFLLKTRSKNHVPILITGAFALFTAAAMCDPYLNLWDEQFHALVAKNMMHHPLTPMLYADTPLDYDYQNWGANHIWLHKQPLFLWEMAVSMNIFGVNEFGIRFPSIIQATLMALLIYGIGKKLHTERTGFLSALLFCMNYFTYNLINGFYSTDHNDLSFAFYVLLSVWAWIKLQEKKSIKFILIIGMAAGCAVLDKWLIGLFVYLVWATAIIINPQKRRNKINYYHFLAALLITVIIFLPWQIYTYLVFPTESAYELRYTSQHFFTAIENHEGDWHYHFDKMREMYFDIKQIAWIIIAAFLFYVYQNRKNLELHLPLASGVVFIYLFFSLAATKMPAFTYIILPLILIIIAFLLDSTWQIIEKSNVRSINISGTILILFIVYFLSLKSIRINKIYDDHTLAKENVYRKSRLEHFKFYRNLKPRSKTILFNTPALENIPAMFYSDITAYDFLPEKNKLEELIKAGYHIMIINNGNLPGYIYENSTIEIIAF